MKFICLAHLISIALIQPCLSAEHLGIFKPNNPRLEGLIWGNWGSRPYEYYWASRVASMANKHVIDLGVGLPSQYNWYKYAAKELNPYHYTGVDADDRIKQEVIQENNYSILHMNMSNLKFENKSFDLAYCISTFEHIPYDLFIKSISEAHRVLKDNGLLILTLDEQWDNNIPLSHGTGWNDLEQSLIKKGLFKPQHLSFGLPDFLNLIKDYFTPLSNDTIIDLSKKTIYSKATGHIYYQRENRDPLILHSPECYNSCVSYAVLKKNTAPIA